MIYFNCPKCRKRLEAIEDWADSFCTCPECGTEMVIPRRPTEKEETTSVTVADVQPTTSIGIKDESAPTEPKTEVRTEEPKKQTNEKDAVIVGAKKFIKSCTFILWLLIALWLIHGIISGYMLYSYQEVGIEEIDSMKMEQLYGNLDLFMKRFYNLIGLSILYYFIKNLFGILLGIYMNTKKA